MLISWSYVLFSIGCSEMIKTKGSAQQTFHCRHKIGDFGIRTLRISLLAQFLEIATSLSGPVEVSCAFVLRQSCIKFF